MSDPKQEYNRQPEQDYKKKLGHISYLKQLKRLIYR